MSDSSREALQSLFFAEYCAEMVAHVPPPTDVDPGSTLYIQFTDNQSVSYTTNPSTKTSSVGFWPNGTGIHATHQIQVVGTGSLYGTTLTTYAITTTVDGQSNTLYVTP